MHTLLHMLQLAKAHDMQLADDCLLSLATHGTMRLPHVVVEGARGGGLGGGGVYCC